MSWVRLDDGAPGHRKIVGLSDAAFRLWIVGLTHCNQQANDGRFSAHAARIMFGYLASPELGKGAAAELVTADLWTQTDEGYEVRNYLEYQPSKAERDSANKAAAERMRNMRARRYQTSVPTDKGQNVRDPLRCNNSGTSDELPEKFALPDPVPTRPDPVPVYTDSSVPSEPSQPALPLQPQQAAESKQPKATRRPGTYTALATALLGELSAARMRVNPKNRIFPPSPAHLRELERCLREGLTVEQLRNVILVWEAMVKAGKQDPEHFDSVTPFRASNVAKYTEKSLEEAAKPRGGVSGTYPGRPAPQEPPRSPVAVENDFQRSLREAREKGEIT